MDKRIVLIHFGNQCGPGIIIDDILKTHDLQLFQLGFFNFNDIFEYLKDDVLHDIYDIKYLKNINGVYLSIHPTITEKTYYHGTNITHSKYNFIFPHNYKLSNDFILNYEHNKKSFIQKIQNFEYIFVNKSIIPYFIIFVNETDDCPNVDNMINLILKKIYKFKIIFFTNSLKIAEQINKSLFIGYYHVRIIDSFTLWYQRPMCKRYDLYKSIYEKFIDTDLKIKSQFPSFEKTYYGMNFSNK
jgi:hypothetical protein